MVTFSLRAEGRGYSRCFIAAAQALEMAGKRKDYDFITANHNALMAEYHAINEVLAPGKDAEEDEDPRPSIPAEVLEDAYTGLYEFAQDENQDLARMIMGTVSNYKLSSEDEERFKKIEEHLSNMDWDGLKTILEEVM